MPHGPDGQDLGGLGMPPRDQFITRVEGEVFRRGVKGQHGRSPGNPETDLDRALLDKLGLHAL